MNNEKPVILIVDDKPANIVSLEALLATNDRKFLHATNGKEALTIILNKKVDLIILDVQMPGMDGFEVAQILKSNKRTKDIPIIFATAEKKELKSMMRGYEEGAIDYLSKPLEPEIVKAKVAVLLKIQLQKKQLLEKNVSLERTKLLINNSADIIGIIDAESLNIIEINKAFNTITNYIKEEVEGASLSSFLNENDRLLIRNLSKQNKERLSFETQIICKDGIIKWLHWNVAVRDKMWFVNARDITENKAVERVKNYLAVIVKQSGDAIYIINEEGDIITWNYGAEKMYGYTEEEASNMNIRGLTPNYRMNNVKIFLTRIMREKKIVELESKRITKPGNIIDVLFSASLIKDELSGKYLISVTERDITQKNIADEEIRQLTLNLEKKVEERTAALSEKETALHLLLEKLYKSEKEIRNFARHLNQVVEEERSHIAREMHDEFGQQLAGIKIELSSLIASSQHILLREKIEKVLREVDILMQSLRKIATQLRPGILDTLGLISSIEWLVKEFRKKTTLECETELNGMDVKFNDEISICFFRICQEALTNISKHANATKVIVETYVNDKTLLLIISDNGKGISNKKLENPFSMGLLGMRERANLIGADLKINSKKDLGTTIQLSVAYK